MFDCLWKKSDIVEWGGGEKIIADDANEFDPHRVTHFCVFVLDKVKRTYLTWTNTSKYTVHSHFAVVNELLYQLLLEEMESASRVQILHEAVCITHCANALGKGKIYLFSFQQWVNSSK